MNSVYDKNITNQPIFFVLSKVVSSVHFSSLYVSFRVKMSWNIRDNRNLFLKLKSKSGPYHVVLTTQKLLPKNLH